MTVFVVIEDYHHEAQTLIAVCATLEAAKRHAQAHSDRDLMPHELAGDDRPKLAEWVPGNSTSAAYFRLHGEPVRKWVSKGDCRDYEIYEMDVHDNG